MGIFTGVFTGIFTGIFEVYLNDASGTFNKPCVVVIYWSVSMNKRLIFFFKGFFAKIFVKLLVIGCTLR